MKQHAGRRRTRRRRRKRKQEAGSRNNSGPERRITDRWTDDRRVLPQLACLIAGVSSRSSVQSCLPLNHVIPLARLLSKSTVIDDRGWGRGVGEEGFAVR